MSGISLKKVKLMVKDLDCFLCITDNHAVKELYISGILKQAIFLKIKVRQQSLDDS